MMPDDDICTCGVPLSAHYDEKSRDAHFDARYPLAIDCDEYRVDVKKSPALQPRDLLTLLDSIDRDFSSLEVQDFATGIIEKIAHKLYGTTLSALDEKYPQRRGNNTPLSSLKGDGEGR